MPSYFICEIVIYQRCLTIVDRCRTNASEDSPDGVFPPNITAWSSPVIVREKSELGGGLDPLLDGEDHNPGTWKM